ncbi:MAG: DUF488 family protein [Flavihumibacter sp.]
MVKTKSVYDKPAPDDGCRVLVDRLWPRGMTREAVVPFVEAHRKDKLITLLYAAKDHEHNQAMVLQGYLQPAFDKLKSKE